MRSRSLRKPLMFRSLPQIRCQSQGLWMRTRSLCMHYLLKSAIVPFLGVNFRFSLKCHTPPPVLLANSFSTRAALLGEQALEVVEGLTVRMQLVHEVMLESFLFAVISEVASSQASLQVTEEGAYLPTPPGPWRKLSLAVLFRPLFVSS